MAASGVTGMWCETCQNRVEVDEASQCRNCGVKVETQAQAPWHFKLLIVAMTLYLTWRLVQLVVWLADKAL